MVSNIIRYLMSDILFRLRSGVSNENSWVKIGLLVNQLIRGCEGFWRRKVQDCDRQLNFEMVLSNLKYRN